MKLRRDERTENSIRFLLNVFEILILFIYFVFVWETQYRYSVYFYFNGMILVFAIYLISLVIFNTMYGGFQIGYSKTSDLIFSQSISYVFTMFIVYIVSAFSRKNIYVLSRLWIWIVVGILLIAILNYVCHKIYFNIFPPKKTLMIYDDDAQSVYDRIVKYQSDSYEITNKIKFESLSENMEEIRDYECTIGVGLTATQKEQLIRQSYSHGKAVYLVPDVYDVIVNGATNVYLVDTPVLKTNAFGPSQIEKIVKRIWDIIFALILLIITSPILLITAFLIKIQDGGPVFYKQVRLTQFGRKFEIIKFRSMKIDAEKDGVARLASDHDDRITKVGKFIRATRIDELPQLLNILKGDMSVVGPRPERPEIQEKILKKVPEFDYRLKVKAGLTGYAQVYGKYNTKLKDKLLFDLLYIEHFSILLDIRIMFMTFKIIFMKESTEGVVEEI